MAVVAVGLVAGCSDLEALPGAAAEGGAGGAGGGSGGAGLAWAKPYSIQAFDETRIGSDPSQDSFHRVQTTIDLHDPPFHRVTLVVELGTTCYPFESWAENPPPPGESWPADCDAFDRNFEISLEPPEGRSPPPALELVRAITPFGGPMQIEQDITDLANALPGRHTLQAHIATWSDGSGQVTGSNGGWFVSARIDVVPGTSPRPVLAVVPLYYDSSGTAAGPGPLELTVPEGTFSGRIEYRATGHGGGPRGDGCIGPADEFCEREHAFWIDEGEVERQILWRDDCDQLCTVSHYGPVGGGFDYCLENPCGALSSVRAPRANWCPGSVTAPLLIDSPALAEPGPHTFEWALDEIGEGGSWRISATYYAFGPPML
jgi:hypothetical protein